MKSATQHKHSNWLQARTWCAFVAVLASTLAVKADLLVVDGPDLRGLFLRGVNGTKLATGWIQQPMAESDITQASALEISPEVCSVALYNPTLVH